MSMEDRAAKMYESPLAKISESIAVLISKC